MILSRRLLINMLGSVMAGASALPVTSIGALAQQTTPPDAANAPKFGYSDVVRKARDLAAASFDTTPPALPESLAKLDAEAYREIRFRPERAFLGNQGGPFRVHLIHPGALYKQAATLNIIRDGVPNPIPYSAALFDYGKTKFERPLPVNLGFGGFRASYPLNDPRAQNDIVSFNAANTCRLLGRNQRAGVSARGLVVTGAGTDPDETPVFKEFWIEPAGPNAEKLTIHALLDSPSATAAYQFSTIPATDTMMDVTVTIFPRKSLTRIGIAPLSSLFLSGENDQRLSGNFRPERHDSDGLLIRSASGEWIWRPLRNAATATTSHFLETNPRGFGLLQRDRMFDHYQDLDRAYENRPSYWIEPRGDWGEGRIDVIEKPGSEETSDNILAFWTPRNPLEPGQSHVWSYRIHATLTESGLHPAGRVLNTFVTVPPLVTGREALPPGSKRVIIDFCGGNLSYYYPAPDQVKAVVTASTGKIVQTTVVANPRIEGFRVTTDLALLAGQSGELRVSLQVAERAITETWVYPVQSD